MVSETLRFKIPQSVLIFCRTTTVEGNDFQKPVCISCSISDDCDWVFADFPDVGDNYMLKCLGPGIPTYTLRSVSNDTGEYEIDYYE